MNKKKQPNLGGYDPETYAAIQSMKDQLLIIFIDRLGGDVTVTVEEIDKATVGRTLQMRALPTTPPALNAPAFQFIIGDWKDGSKKT